MVTPGQRGFSLVEIVTVLAVVGVLAAMAMPSFRGLLADARIRSVASELHASLLLARSEAAKTNARVLVVAAESGWEGGWTVRNAQGTVLFSGKPQTQVSVRGGPPVMTYLPSGRVLGPAPSFQLAGSTGLGQVRCVSAEVSGHASILKAACS